MIDMDAVIQFLMFGAVGTPGGVMLATGLAEGSIVEASDGGERPDLPFMTFDLLDVSGPVYGQPGHPYVRVDSHPSDATQCLLVYDNAEDLSLRVEMMGEQPGQTKASLFTIIKNAKRYFEGQAGRDLDLAALQTFVVDSGNIRDARTALNLKTELRWAFEVVLRTDDQWTVAVPVFDQFTGTFAEDHGEQEDLNL